MVDWNDLRIDTYRSQGASGPIDRIVRVTHIPSGIVAVSRGKATEAEDRDAAIAEIEEKLRGAEPSS